MYKLEDRVLFDAALPVDIAEAADDVSQQDQHIDDDHFDSADAADSAENIIDSYDQNQDYTSETGELAELVENLTEIPEESLTSELYIIDKSVPDYQKLVLHVPEGAEVEFLEVGSDGVETISDILEDYKELDALHILSHGENGEMRVGDDSVTSENLSVYSDEIEQWDTSLNDGADILLYSCNLAETDQGKQLVAAVSALTNADVAASVDVTGESGDWALEHTTGSIEAITLNAANSYDYNLSTAPTGGAAITVTIGDDHDNSVAAQAIYNDDDNNSATSDSRTQEQKVQAAWDVLSQNKLSLREAIWYSNLVDGAEKITFTDDVDAVTLSSNLAVTTDITIEGNGTDKTTIALGNKQLQITQGIDDGNSGDTEDNLDVTLTGLKFTGVGSDAASHWGSMIKAFGSADNNLNLTILSSEMTGHYNQNTETGALHGEKINLVMTNNLIEDIKAGKGTAILLRSSTSVISGITIKDMTIDRDYAKPIQMFSTIGTNTVEYASFINCTVTENFRNGSGTYVQGTTASNSVQINCTYLSPVSGIVDGTLEGTVESRNGVTFYHDETDDAGADDFTAAGYFIDKDPIQLTIADTTTAGTTVNSDDHANSNLLHHDSTGAIVISALDSSNKVNVTLIDEADVNNSFTVTLTVDLATGAYVVSELDQLPGGVTAKGLLKYTVDGEPRELAITVVGANDAPVVDNVGSVNDSFSIEAGGTGTYNVMDPLNPLFTDVDNSTLTLSCSNALASGITFDKASGFTIQSGAAAGVYEYTVVASDGDLSVSKLVTITVTPPNQAPIGSISDQSVILTGTTDPDLTYNIKTSFSDADGVIDSFSFVDAGGQKLDEPVPGITIDNDGVISVDQSVVAAGSYTLRVTATDEDKATSAASEFTLTVKPVGSTVNITVTTGVEDNDTVVTTGKTLDQVIAEIGNDGLSLREAVWAAEQFDGAEKITFADNVSSVILADNIAITTDMTIEGNGADETIIALSTSGKSITVTQTSDTALNVAFNKLKFTGNTGSDKALIIVKGKGIDADGNDIWEDAVMANVTIESSEFADHVSTLFGGAYRAYFANMTLSNVYIHDMTAARGAGGYGEMSNLTMTGLTLADSVGSADWGGFVMFDARNTVTIGGKLVDASFTNTLSSNVSFSSFINNTTAKAQVSMLNLLTASKSVSDSIAFGNTTFVEHGAWSWDGIKLGDLTVAGSATLSSDTRDSIAFYEDNVVGKGADELTGYFIDKDPIDLTIADDSTAGTTVNSNDIAGSNLLFHDITGTIDVPGLSSNKVNVTLVDEADYNNKFTITLTINLADGSYVVSGLDELPKDITAKGKLKYTVNGEPRELAITATGVNDTPVVISNSDSLSMSKAEGPTGKSFEAELAAYFNDVDKGDVLTYELVSVDGGHAISYSGGKIVFTDPSIGSGEYSLNFIARDLNGLGSITQTITLKIENTEVNETTPQDKIIKEDGNSVAKGVVEVVDGQFNESVTEITTAYGTIKLEFNNDVANNRGTVRWTYTFTGHDAINHYFEGQELTDSFSVSSTNGVSTGVNVLIKGTNDAPDVVTSAPATKTVAIGGSVKFDPSVYFTDVDGTVDHYTVVAKDSSGNVVKDIKYSESTGFISVADGVAEGDYTVIITATDNNGATTATSFTLTTAPAVVPPDFNADRVIITVTTGDDDNDIATATATTRDGLIKELGADGLSFREAVYIANTIDGAEYIMFATDVANISIESDLIIDSDLSILGNGADQTMFQFSGAWTTLSVEGGVNVSIQGVRFSGNDAGKKNMLTVTGKRIDDKTADLAIVTLNSVEFVDHTTTGTNNGAAIRSVLANITIQNAYFSNIKAQSGTVLSAASSVINIDGITVTNCSTDPADWKSLVNLDNKNSDMSFEYLKGQSVTIRHSTFTGNSLNSKNTNVIALLGKLETPDDKFQTFVVEHNTFAGNYVFNSIYTERPQLSGADKSTNVEDNTQDSTTYLEKALKGELSTRNGVRYYAGEDTQNAAFADSGADELTGYEGIPVLDTNGSVRNKYIYEKPAADAPLGEQVSGKYHIFSSVDPLFTDADLSLVDNNGDGIADEQYLYVMSQYAGEGAAPAGINISNGGLVTVALGTPEGVYEYHLIVDDGKGGIARTTFKVIVVAKGSPNIAPEYTPVEEDDSYVHSVTPGQEVNNATLTVASWFDRHGHEFTFSARLVDGNALPGWITLNTDGTFTIDEVAAPAGGMKLDIILTATEVHEADDNGNKPVALSSSYKFSFVLNHSPQYTDTNLPTVKPDDKVVVSVSDGNTQQREFWRYFSDSDHGDDLDFYFVDADGKIVDAPLGLTLNRETGIITVDEKMIAYGNTTFNLMAVDTNGGASITKGEDGEYISTAVIGKTASVHEFTLYSEGHVVRDVEVGTTHNSNQYFEYLGGGSGSNYTLEYLSNSGAVQSSLPDGISIDSTTGDISIKYQTSQQAYLFRITRTNSVGALETREVTLNLVPSTTALVINDVYIARVGGTLEDAFKHAIENAPEDATIIFDISKSYIDAHKIPLGYNSDFDGDGDRDIYLTYSSDITIDKSLTIIFDTDAKGGDRDVIIVGAGFKIEGKYDIETKTRFAPEVNLSEFAVVGARTSIFHHSAVVNITDADFANGTVAYYIDSTDPKNVYKNEVTLTNINIYGMNTSKIDGYAWDLATLYVAPADKFVGTNIFMGNNTYEHTFIRSTNKAEFKNITIADNKRVGGTKGAFINSGGAKFDNATIVDNEVTAFSDWNGNIQVPGFISGSFTNSLVVGNIMPYWYDDAPGETPDDVTVYAFNYYNTTYKGTFNQITNTYSTKEDILNLPVESSDDYLNGDNGKRTFILADGVIHYVDTASDTYAEFANSNMIKGSFNPADFKTLADVLRYNRANQFKDLDSVGGVEDPFKPTDGVDQIAYDKSAANGPIDVAKYFLADGKVLVTDDYTISFYNEETGLYESTMPQGFKWDAAIKQLTYTREAVPGTYRIHIEATFDGHTAVKEVRLNIANNAPVLTNGTAANWTNYTRGDVTSGADLSFDLGTDGSNGANGLYFNDLYEDGALGFDITSVMLNGRRISPNAFAIVNGDLTIVDKFLAAGTYSISVKATDDNGGVSAQPLVVSLTVVDDGRVHAADGGAIQVTTGLDSDNRASAASAYNSYSGTQQEKLQAAWDVLKTDNLSLREAVWFAQLNGGKTDAIIVNSAVTLNSGLEINSSVSINGARITGNTGSAAVITIAQSASVALNSVSFENVTTSNVLINNNGRLIASVISVSDTSAATLINTSAGSSAFIRNLSAVDNTISGQAVTGWVSIANSTIVGSGDTTNLRGFGLITNRANLVVDPVSGSYAYGMVNGIKIVSDNTFGGADQGLEKLPAVSVIARDNDGYALGFGERSKVVASVSDNGGSYFWYADGSLITSQVGSEFVIDTSYAGKQIVLKYARTDANGFMDVQTIVIGRVSTDTHVPDAPVINEEPEDIDEMDATPELTGTAEANSRVELTITKDGVVFERTIILSDAAGNWSFEANYLYGGDYDVTALALSVSSIESAATKSMTFTISPNARDENPMQGLSPVVNSAGSTAAPDVTAPDNAELGQDGDDMLAGEDVESDTDEFDEFVEDMTGDEGSVKADKPVTIRSAASKLSLQPVGSIIYGESNLIVRHLNDTNSPDESVQGYVNTIFDAVDVDGDGVIEEREMPTDGLIKFRDLDLDDDGEIDEEELIEFLEDYDGDKNIVMNVLKGDHVLDEAPKVSQNFKNSLQKALTSLFTL